MRRLDRQTEMTPLEILLQREETQAVAQAVTRQRGETSQRRSLTRWRGLKEIRLELLVILVGLVDMQGYQAVYVHSAA